MKTMILVDGGALAAGAKDTEFGGWAARLHRDSLAAGWESPEPIEVLNFARASRSLTNIALGRKITSDPSYESRLKGERISNEIGSRLVSILAVGHNEAIRTADIEPSLEEFHLGLGRICAAASAQSVPLILLGPNQIDQERADFLDMERSHDNDIIIAYGDIMALAARDHQAAYIDTISLFGLFGDQLLSEDGCNPSAMGHSLIHDAVKKELDLLNVRL